MVNSTMFVLESAFGGCVLSLWGFHTVSGIYMSFREVNICDMYGGVKHDVLGKFFFSKLYHAALSEASTFPPSLHE